MHTARRLFAAAVRFFKAARGRPRLFWGVIVLLVVGGVSALVVALHQSGSPAPKQQSSNVSQRKRSVPTGASRPAPTLQPPRTGNTHTATWWKPTGNIPWQWELDHPLNTASVSDMGTNATTYIGAPAPNPVVYDIDGFNNPASTIATLHSKGFHAICYMEVGAAESFRPDYGAFPASTLGSVVPDYSNERYLNINDPAVTPVIKQRIAMCASKGFDAVEPDLDNTYSADTGFAITAAQNAAYNAQLADYAHSLGLGYGLKNGDDPGYTAQMVSHVDFVLDEQCFEFDTCSAFYPIFSQAGKAVFEVEYNIPTSKFCAQANAYDFNAVAQDVALNGGRKPCR